VVVKDDSLGSQEWMISIDSTNVRAHQHSAAYYRAELIA